MTRFLAPLGFLLALAAWPAAAAANCSPVPYTFTNGSIADANQVNADFSALVTCVNANTIYASNIVPSTVAQALFGGTQPYAFPNGLTGPLSVSDQLSVTGPVYAASDGATLAPTIPVYNAAGVARAATMHAVEDSCTFTGVSTCNVAFTNAAAFANSAYMCSMGGSETTAFWTVESFNQTPVGFQMVNLGYSGTGTGPQAVALASGTIVPFVCIGS